MKKVTKTTKPKAVKKKSITEQVQDFESACVVLKRKPNLPNVKLLPKKHGKSIIAFYMLTTIIEALNQGWTPNWNDYSEYKYYNYFWIDADKKTPTGFGFSAAGYAYAYACTHTRVGSRLCFKSSELADYARKKFTKLYQDYLLI